MIHDEKKNQAMKPNAELIQKTEVEYKHIKKLINIVYTSRRQNRICCSKLGKYKNIKFKFLEIKSIISQVKHRMDGIKA